MKVCDKQWRGIIEVREIARLIRRPLHGLVDNRRIATHVLVGNMDLEIEFREPRI